MMPDVCPAPRDDPTWMAGYAAGIADARDGTVTTENPHGLAWRRGYMVGRQVDQPVAAPAGWPTLIAIATLNTFLRAATTTWPHAMRVVVPLAAGAATQRLGARSGRRRAGRLGYVRMGDLPPIDPLASLLGPTVAMTLVRLVWWRLRYGRAELPRAQRTAPRELARGVIVTGIQRLEWDRRTR